jgi:hypothetical protein
MPNSLKVYRGAQGSGLATDLMLARSNVDIHASSATSYWQRGAWEYGTVIDVAAIM